MKMIANVCIPRSPQVTRNLLSHNWSRCVVGPAMRLAQYRSRQPRRVVHPPTVLRIGHHRQWEGSEEHGVQIHKHLQKGDKMDKDDRNMMEYVVIILRARSGTRKEVPGKVIGLLWIDISHGMLWM